LPEGPLKADSYLLKSPRRDEAGSVYIPGRPGCSPGTGDGVSGAGT